MNSQVCKFLLQVAEASEESEIGLLKIFHLGVSITRKDSALYQE